MVRSSLSLDGAWPFIHDPEDIGWREKWFIKPPKGQSIHDLPVPGLWQHALPDAFGTGWYFCTFYVPESFAGLHTDLVLDGVEYYVQAWLNGDGLGAHEGGCVPFRMDTSQWLVPGDYNYLVLRVLDPTGLPEAQPCEEHSFGGVWGSVRLEATKEPWIHQVFVIPHVENRTLEITTQVRHTRQQPVPVTVIHELVPWGEETDASLLISASQTGTAEPKGGFRAIHSTVSVPDIELWSPKSPILYGLRTRLLDEDGQKCDRTENRFGMRAISASHQGLCLNGESIELREWQQTPEYPVAGRSPKDEQALRQELLVIHQAGYNLLRIYPRNAYESVLRIADEIGLLVGIEPPLAGLRYTDALRDCCIRTLQETVIHLRNYPCVLLWETFNPNGHYDSRVKPLIQELSPALGLEIRRLDPTRPVISEIATQDEKGSHRGILLPFTEDWLE